MPRLAINPITSASQYGLAQSVASGTSVARSSMTPAVAREMIAKTPARLRRQYAAELAQRRKNLAPTPRPGSRGYDVVIGARRKHFDSHTAAHRYGTDQQNKGVHAGFVIVDSATRKREEFKRGGERNPIGDWAAHSWTSARQEIDRLKTIYYDAGRKYATGAGNWTASGAWQKSASHPFRNMPKEHEFPGGGKWSGRPKDFTEAVAKRAFTEGFMDGARKNPKQKEVSFTTDKHGRPIAYKFTRGAVFPRNIRIGYDEAKLLVSTGQAKEIPYRPMRREWMTTNKKSNPEAAAAEMREKFTGLPSKRVEVVGRDEHVHSHLAALGELMELKVKTVKGQVFEILFNREKNPKGRPITAHTKGWVDRRFKAVSGLGKSLARTWINPKRLNPEGPVLLCSTEDGKHLYIEGGKQDIDLTALGLSELKDKESAVVGIVTKIVYHARKKFDGKEEEYDYVHKFSEESGGLRPTLRYDIRNKHLYLDGGVYYVPKPLVGTSQGITD